ncbi:MAG: UBP-type zinc finger domain-containing protein [Micromonosporaceae bacterium]
MAGRACRSELNGSATRCDHLDDIRTVAPGSRRCAKCAAGGTTWNALLLCLSCGWVACSDDSPGQHAKAHYEETDHAVAAAMEPGSTWRWCFAHQRVV